MNTVLSVRIKYPGKPRAETDERLRSVGENWASGYNFENNVRDLAFDDVPLGSDLAYLIESMPSDAVAELRIVGQSNP